MPRRSLILPGIALFSLATRSLVAAGDGDTPKKLEITQPIACKVVRAYRDYDEVDELGQTRDEKLMVYYEPSNYHYEKVKSEYQVHFTQDARVRRRGQKAVLMAKDKLMDYKAKFDRPPRTMYLANTISLKNIPPGDYDLEIILRDELGKGPAIHQVMPFRVRDSTETKTAEPKPSGKTKKSRD